jgi:hypothetical protein
MTENSVRRVRKTIPIDQDFEAAHAQPQSIPEPPPVSIPEPPAPKAPKAVFYRAKKLPIFHPYQGILIPVDGQVPLYLDSWTKVQLQAGVIETV